MNKILAVFDGLKLSQSTADYAIFMAKQFNAHIVAVFLQDIAYRSEPIGVDIWWPYYTETDMDRLKTIEQKDVKTRAASVVKLTTLFERNGVHFTIHQNKYLAFTALLNESHFADLIVIEETAAFSNYDKKIPSRFVKDLLHDADCPVMLLPKKFRLPEKIVFAYDGSPSSVYAIRQFSYIFPQLNSLAAEIIYITLEKNSTHLPETHLIHELLKRKYPEVKQQVIRQDGDGQALLSYLAKETASCIVVMGAYKRSALSMLLHRSEADILIKELELPLFIAHR
jgi:nucleotide-binding universal stress UspA family protein